MAGLLSSLPQVPAQTWSPEAFLGLTGTTLASPHGFSLPRSFQQLLFLALHPLTPSPSVQVGGWARVLPEFPRAW